MASASVADSTSTHVVTFCAARCRSLAFRTRSARESERAVVAMNAANAKIVTAAAMARPSASLKSPARCPAQREPAEAGGDEDRGGQHATREDPARVVADDHRHESRVRDERRGCRRPARGERDAVGNAMGCIADAVHCLSAPYA